MALTYEQSSELMKDAIFTGRVKVSCLKFADYVVGEATNTPAHNTRFKWAQYAMANPDAAALAVTPLVVMDPAVQADGSAIDDASLQAATENAINKML